MKKVIVSLFVIILIAAVGVGGWYLWNSLQKEKNKTEELEKKTAQLENKLNELGGNKDTNQNTDNSNQQANSDTYKNDEYNTNDKQDNASTKNLSENEALNIMKNNYEAVTDCLFDNYEQNIIWAEKNQYGVNVVEINGGYYSGQIKDDVIKMIRDRTTKNAFKDVIELLNIDEINEKFYIQADIGTNDPSYLSHSFKVLDIKDNEIIGKLLVKRDQDEDGEYDVKLVKENGKWLVDTYKYDV